MKKSIWALCLIFCVAASPLMSQPAGGRTFGLGIVLGEPLGIATRLWLGQKAALNLVVGWGSGAWNDRYRGYRDSRCYDNGFYRNNVSYCNGQAYGWGANPYQVFHINGDYLFQNLDLIKSTQKFAVYYGPGVNFNMWDGSEIDVGARGNIGLAWFHATAPFDIFFELAPIFILVPGMNIDISAGLGAHYYF